MRIQQHVYVSVRFIIRSTSDCFYMIIPLHFSVFNDTELAGMMELLANVIVNFSLAIYL